MTIETNNNVRLWAVFCHLAALTGLFSGIGFVLGPLIVWLIRRNEYAFVDDQGKEAVNFQITMILALIAVAVVGAVAAPFTCGVTGMIAELVMFFLLILMVVMPIIGAIQASTGRLYRYPESMIIRLID